MWLMFLDFPETTFPCVVSWGNFVRIPQRTGIRAILVMHFVCLIVQKSIEEQHFMRYWVDLGFVTV